MKFEVAERIGRKRGLYSAQEWIDHIFEISALIFPPDDIQAELQELVDDANGRGIDTTYKIK